MGKLHLIGNLIVDSWFDHFRYPGSQKPNPVAPIILGEIVSWYRPYDVKDETTGMRLPPRKRFQGEALQLRYLAMSNKFGFSKKQIREAMDLLEESGVISTRLETIDTPQGRWGNVMFVSLNVNKLEEISFSPIAPQVTRVVSHAEQGCDVQDNTLPIIKPIINPVLERELDPPKKIELDRQENSSLEDLLNYANECFMKNMGVNLFVGEIDADTLEQGEKIFRGLCKGNEKKFRILMERASKRWESCKAMQEYKRYNGSSADPNLGWFNMRRGKQMFTELFKPEMVKYNKDKFADVGKDSAEISTTT